MIKAKKSLVGRCDISGCGKPAAYVQNLPGSRFFRYCEEHAPAGVKKAAEMTEAEGKAR